ncbi:MAG: lipoyl synthase [Alphaproteobacteria bacterium]|nr:lipoyl synthase [Alphaproteobacteria bacterium]
MSEKLERPNWIRVPASVSRGFTETLNVIKEAGVHTVCEEAMCPNIGECWRNKTATFLIMGNKCTRNCGFCNVKHGRPAPLDENEPMKVAQSVQKLGIKYAVITCVTRDDIKDGGAQHFADVIKAIRSINPETKVEILTSDLRGNVEAIQTIVDAQPDVFGHNLEVVRKFHKQVKRPPADYDVSLNFLKTVKKIEPKMITKTGIMVGVGETKEDVFELIDDVIDANIDILTIGQYLPPTSSHYPIARYVTPEEFAEYAEYGKSRGIEVISGALVRSSYKARETHALLGSSENT